MSHGIWRTTLFHESEFVNYIKYFDRFSLRFIGFHDIVVRISLVRVLHMIQGLGHDTVSARRLEQYHIPEDLNFHEHCCESLLLYSLHFLIRGFCDCYASEFFYVSLFLIL
jgi:hypothetical protein